MKHYHQKEYLTDVDVDYFPVEPGRAYRLTFGKVDTYFLHQENEQKIYQGVKLWIKRCTIALDGIPVDSAKAIIWYRPTEKAPMLSNGHYHWYTAETVNIHVMEAEDEAPTLGIFNVWSPDMIKCYEFGAGSWIRATKQHGQVQFQAKHGLAVIQDSTMHFSIALIT